MYFECNTLERLKEKKIWFKMFKNLGLLTIILDSFV